MPPSLIDKDPPLNRVHIYMIAQLAVVAVGVGFAFNNSGLTATIFGLLYLGMVGVSHYYDLDEDA